MVHSLRPVGHESGPPERGSDEMVCLSDKPLGNGQCRLYRCHCHHHSFMRHSFLLFSTTPTTPTSNSVNYYSRTALLSSIWRTEISLLTVGLNFSSLALCLANGRTDYLGLNACLVEWADSYDTKDWDRLRKCIAPTLRVGPDVSFSFRFFRCPRPT